jgi:hypothetical protein
MCEELKHSHSLNLKRIWTADQLDKRRPNCVDCQLYKRVAQAAAHLLFQCQFSAILIKDWLGQHDLDHSTSQNFTLVNEWLSVTSVFRRRRRQPFSCWFHVRFGMSLTLGLPKCFSHVDHHLLQHQCEAALWVIACMGFSSWSCLFQEGNPLCWTQPSM